MEIVTVAVLVFGAIVAVKKTMILSVVVIAKTVFVATNFLVKTTSAVLVTMKTVQHFPVVITMNKSVVMEIA
mgnify:CR=1 FL=1